MIDCVCLYCEPQQVPPSLKLLLVRCCHQTRKVTKLLPVQDMGIPVPYGVKALGLEPRLRDYPLGNHGQLSIFRPFPGSMKELRNAAQDNASMVHPSGFSFPCHSSLPPAKPLHGQEFSITSLCQPCPGGDCQEDRQNVSSGVLIELMTACGQS